MKNKNVPAPLSVELEKLFPRGHFSTEALTERLAKTAQPLEMPSYSQARHRPANSVKTVDKRGGK